MSSNKIYTIILAISFLALFNFAEKSPAQNPIVKNIGLCDPQVRVYNDHVWLYATHDASAENTYFEMHDWWIWSSSDLVNWKYESTLDPRETYYKAPSINCWATDAMCRNGKYYFYFSMGPTDIGVVTGDSPAGPWKDPIKKALIPSTMTPVRERDPGILMDDSGIAYIVFGSGDFYIARLNDDMVSLAEEPRKMILDHKQGAYGMGTLDDKSFIHKYKGKYYLSWGCYYAMSEHVYGPYVYKGCFFSPDRLSPEFRKPDIRFDVGRHGSFFELHNQWYFICGDRSTPGSTPYYRNSVIGYVHYRENGEIEPVYIDTTGVGRYNAASTRIQAENYFKAADVKKQEFAEGEFDIRDIRHGSYLVYPNVMNLQSAGKICFHAASGNPAGGTIEVRKDGPEGELLGKCKIFNTGDWSTYRTFECEFKNSSPKTGICLVFIGGTEEFIRLDWFGFKLK